ncbi:MAG: guanylate kinase [Kiritimatiellaeota bacterium]|nr:guanylate kinase [Kiritimatiellota bacterium]
MLTKCKLIVVSAPSGAGKSTLCDRLLAGCAGVMYSVSCTTRSPRGEEKDGAAYFFMTKETFLEKVGRGEFLEHALVHGNHYGTLKATVYEAFAMENSILMDIDVAGAKQIRDYVMTLPAGDALRDGFVDVFIMPPSMEELRRRLMTRGEDTADTIDLRMKNAVAEMAEAPLYRHVLVNDILDDTYRRFTQILQLRLAMARPGVP